MSIKRYKINLSIGSLISTYLILMGLFYYSCENTITKSLDILDCYNIPNGSASLDDCGLCTGGTTIFEFNYLMDCEGECGGSAVVDCAGECSGDAFNDNCGDCVHEGDTSCEIDCDNIDGGTAIIDNCGECVGGNTGSTACIEDDCGVWGGDNSTCIVINEINYNSPDDFNPEDWVELYNSSGSPINIGNWKLKDEANNHVFIIPENTILSAGEFIVLCKDTTAFTSLFPEVINFIGDLGFGLKRDGDQVRLFDSSESLVLIDKVEYYNTDSWPIGPDGTGPTLELIHPSLDNALGENWTASNGNGTPGEINSVYNDE